MAQIKKLSICMIMLVITAMACGPLQQPTAALVLKDTSTVAPTLEPSYTLTPSSTLTPISTLSPTEIPVPTITPTQLVEQTGPFRSVTSLAGLLTDASGEVQLRALVDGKVWVITSQSALRWNGQEWEVALSSSKDVQMAVDDGGVLWVLYQDINEISAWKGGDWIIYGAGRGWESVGAFEVSWWAPEPWSIFTGRGGMLWTAMEQDVRKFDGNRWNLYSLNDMGFPPQEDVDISIVHSLAIVKGGAEVWVGECYYSGPGPMGGGGVRWFDGQTWQGADAPIGSKCVSALEVDATGDVWLGAYEIIWHYEHASQTWADYRLPEELITDYNFAYPRQIIVDQVGDVWVIMQMCGGASCGVAENLYRIHNGEWSLIITADYSQTGLRQLALDGNRQGWLFWEGMVYRLGDQPLEPFEQVEARGVSISPNGLIWVVAGSGDDASLQVFEP